jgi:hypothetical protein
MKAYPMPEATTVNPYLTLTLECLKRRMLSDPPSIVLIELAQNLINNYPREELPDWIEILANGNPDNILAVVEIARSDCIEAETINHDNIQSNFQVSGNVDILLFGNRGPGARCALAYGDASTHQGRNRG